MLLTLCIAGLIRVRIVPLHISAQPYTVQRTNYIIILLLRNAEGHKQHLYAQSTLLLFSHGLARTLGPLTNNNEGIEKKTFFAVQLKQSGTMDQQYCQSFVCLAWELDGEVLWLARKAQQINASHRIQFCYGPKTKCWDGHLSAPVQRDTHVVQQPRQLRANVPYPTQPWP